MAHAWARVGAPDEALEVLERWVGPAYSCAAGPRTDPWWAGLRAWPEFGSLLERAEAARAAGVEAFEAAGGGAVLGIETG